MNDRVVSHPDAARSQLRALVVAIDGELARLPAPATTGDRERSPDGLRASWAQLVEQLALGPEPEVRECPTCGHTGMRTASVCGYCWTSLSPLAAKAAT